MTDITIALLRGINVGGHRKLPMADLRALLTDLGAEDPRTYIQSGNAVFRGTLAASEITAAIEARHGFAPHVIALTLADYETRLAAMPFPDLHPALKTAPKLLHLFFLDGDPQPLSDTFRAAAAPGERVAIAAGIAWLHAPDGIGRSKLADRLEKALGVPATARNWQSARAIHDLARSVRS